MLQQHDMYKIVFLKQTALDQKMWIIGQLR